MKETIEKNFAFLDDDQLAQAAEELDRAERIFIYAHGDSEIRAKSFQNKLMKINKYAVIATELSEISIPVTARMNSRYIKIPLARDPDNKHGWLAFSAL